MKLGEYFSRLRSFVHTGTHPLQCGALLTCILDRHYYLVYIIYIFAFDCISITFLVHKVLREALDRKIYWTIKALFCHQGNLVIENKSLNKGILVKDVNLSIMCYIDGDRNGFWNYTIQNQTFFTSGKRTLKRNKFQCKAG